jgi:hypothetical protein
MEKEMKIVAMEKEEITSSFGGWRRGSFLAFR